MKKLLIFLFITFAVSGTSFGQMPKIEAGVSKELAKWRTENYSDIVYKLDITLERMSPTIDGTVEISLFNKGDLIILDWRKFKGKEDSSKISKLSVNGKTAYFEELNGHLILKEGVLKNRPNTIRFDFTSPIDGGASVKRFVDKDDDDAEYVYSQFSADKNTPFPVFDQPDLKARFQLGIRPPYRCKVVSNTAVNSRVRMDPMDWGHFIFEETKPIGIDAFAFATGDFAEIKDEADIGAVKTAPKGSSIIYEPLKNPNAAKVYVRKSQEQKFRQTAAEFFLQNRKKDKFAKLDIILLPEIFNIQSDYDGIKFVPESSVFK